MLSAAEEGLSVPGITEKLNLTKTEVERVLKSLSVLSPAPIVKVGTRFQLTPFTYAHDDERDERLKRQRTHERERFVSFAAAQSCYIELVRRELDDPSAEPCRRCANCIGTDVVSANCAPGSLQAALAFLNRSEFKLTPRKRWPKAALPGYGLSGNIPDSQQCAVGLCLSQFGDPGVAGWVHDDKASGFFRDELVEVLVDAIRRELPESDPDWVCAVPSLRSSELVPNFARRVAAALGVPYTDSVVKVKSTEPQKEQRNSFHQARNLDAAFEVRDVSTGTALLVDDMVDSGWTLTIIGALLRRAGATSVVPVALASTANRSADE